MQTGTAARLRSGVFEGSTPSRGTGLYALAYKIIK